MRAVAPPDQCALSRRPQAGPAGVALACLDASEQGVVRQLRAALAIGDGRPDVREGLPATAPGAPAIFVRYARELRQDPDAAAARDNPAVTHAEARTLRAIDCMRAGLLGEAWKVLSEICAPGRAGAALIALEAVAATTGQAGLSSRA